MKANEIELTLISVKKLHMTSEDRKALSYIDRHERMKKLFENEGLDKREKKAWKRLRKELTR